MTDYITPLEVCPFCKGPVSQMVVYGNDDLTEVTVEWQCCDDDCSYEEKVTVVEGDPEHRGYLDTCAKLIGLPEGASREEIVAENERRAAEVDLPPGVERIPLKDLKVHPGVVSRLTAEELRENLSRDMSSTPRPCRLCGEEWTPTSFNFHGLCPTCFAEFDEQKMKGRFGKSEDWFESATKWVEWKKSQT